MVAVTVGRPLWWWKVLITCVSVLLYCCVGSKAVVGEVLLLEALSLHVLSLCNFVVDFVLALILECKRAASMVHGCNPVMVSVLIGAGMV